MEITMSDDGNKKADHDALAGAIARALAPQFTGLREEIGTLRSEMNVRFGQMNERLDQIVENTGGHYRGLESRVSRLEAKVFRDE